MNFTNLLIDYIIVLNIGLLLFLVIFTRILKKELKENILNIICVIGGIFSLIFLSIKPKNKLLYIISYRSLVSNHTCKKITKNGT